jgi:hypothetical protein
MKAKLLSVIMAVLLPVIIMAQNDIYQSEKFVKIWEVKGLSVPESVLPVPAEGIMYVSNIGVNNPTEKEGKGFISILTLDGKIKNLKWCTGLNSPKGMAISGDKLFVTEVDRVAEIDLKTGQKIKDYPVEGAVFLNDIAAEKNGALYISDSRTGTIHRLKDGVVSVFIRSDDFPNPNGVVFKKDMLLLGTGDKIVKIDPSTKEVKDYRVNTGGVDGLAVVNNETVIFSDWPGKIHIMNAGEEKELLLDTSSTEMLKTADFGYESNKKLVYIPTFFGNSVVCYKLELD